MTLRDFLDLLLQRGADGDQIKRGIDFWDSLDDESPVDPVVLSEPNDISGASHTRRVARNEIIARSTHNISVQAISDWVTIDTMADLLGADVLKFRDQADRAGLSQKLFASCPPLVSKRQCFHWSRHQGELREANFNAFTGWERQSDLAKLFGVDGHVLSQLHADGKLAIYKQHVRLVLLYKPEVKQVLRAENLI